MVRKGLHMRGFPVRFLFKTQATGWHHKQMYVQNFWKWKLQHQGHDCMVVQERGSWESLKLVLPVETLSHKAHSEA